MILDLQTSPISQHQPQSNRFMVSLVLVNIGQIIVVAWHDRGAGNIPEALRLAFHHGHNIYIILSLAL